MGGSRGRIKGGEKKGASTSNNLKNRLQKDWSEYGETTYQGLEGEGKKSSWLPTKEGVGD